MLFVIVGVVMIALIAEPNEDYPLPELEKRFVRTGIYPSVNILEWSTPVR